jgi:4-cresol dehydrogenase (hydroxylating)
VAILSRPRLGSIVGNTLEYGRGYTPYGDHASTACGLEVVLANGDILRTRMGAVAGSKSWHVYTWSFGPTHTGLFMQSNFGIVTKMGVWLMPAPEEYRSCWVTFQGDAPVAGVIDVLRTLMLEGTIRNYPTLFQGISTAWPRAGRRGRMVVAVRALRPGCGRRGAIRTGEDRIRGCR